LTSWAKSSEFSRSWVSIFLLASILHDVDYIPGYCKICCLWSVVSIAAADPKKSIRSTVSEVPELQAKLGGYGVFFTLATTDLLS
jgi:hypothetical protein